MPYEKAAMYSDAYNGIALTQGATVELGGLLIPAKAAAERPRGFPVNTLRATGAVDSLFQRAGRDTPIQVFAVPSD